MTNFADQAPAMVILVDYLFGLAFGVIGSMIFGSVLENHAMSLLREAPDPISAGAREFFGLFTRDDDGYLRSLTPGEHKAPRGAHRDGSSGSHGQGTER
jgi:hypothetical protein